MTVERLVTADVPLNEHRLTAHQMHELHSLILWLDGFVRGSKEGIIPGHFELVILYRTLADYQGQAKAKK